MSKQIGKENLQLRKEFGIFYGVFVIMGLIIGGGIYISPQLVLRYAGSPGLTLIMWIMGGIFSMIGALCYAEIGTKYPRSGGSYAYLIEFYGPYLGFLYLWQNILLQRGGSDALKATVSVRFLLSIFYPTCSIPLVAVKCISSFIAIFICFLNCLSVKFMARTQSFMVSLSIATLVVISLFGPYNMAKGDMENMSNPFENTSKDPANIVFSFYSTIFPFVGWNALNFIAEEVKNPKRTFPIAISIAIFLTSCLYFLVNFSYLSVLGKNEMLESEAVAITMAYKFWKPLMYIFSFCIFITASSSFQSGILVGSRILFSGARNGLAPQILSCISVTRYTPMLSITLQMTTCLFYIWFINIDTIIKNISFTYVAMDTLILLAFIRRRYKKINPNARKEFIEFPLVLHIIFALISFLICLVPLITKPFETVSIAGSVFLLNSLLYLLFIKIKILKFSKNSKMGSIFHSVQIMFACALPDKH